MAYVDTGGESEGGVVFLHGNPTSSYLWRNIIPHVAPLARCLAPDLVGMGESDATPNGSYRFADHSRYLDSWFDAALPEGPVTLVVHDWGSALGFHWAHRHPERIQGLVYMEAIVRPVTWDEWPEAAKQVFQGFRSEAGETMVLERNIFVERVLPGSTIRGISDEAMEVYRRRYVEPGESRRPTLSWPREIPIDGEPPDVVAIVAEYAEWLSQTDAQAVRQRRTGRHPHRPAARVLPHLRQPARGYGPRRPLHPGRLTARDRSRNRRVVLGAVNC